ncbi:MAG: hypothetical protein QOG67_443 [Verrucomicrobiota bacterium]|jgi:hypothetical protein
MSDFQRATGADGSESRPYLSVWTLVIKCCNRMPKAGRDISPRRAVGPLGRRQDVRGVERDLRARW